MRMEVPVTLRPVWRFTVHVVLGAIAFLVVFFVAVSIGLWGDYAARHGAHDWIIYYGHWAEKIIFWTDMGGLGLFLLKEFIKLARQILLKDWDD